ncbi:MAG: hypothetical protein AB9903_08990 [Vulcanimicrobiota bacterium]
MNTVKYRLHREGFIWWFIHRFFMKSPVFALTLFSHIFLPSWFFEEEGDEIEKQALLLHEIEHVRQWQRERLSFIAGYLFSAEKRRIYELEGFRVQISFLVSNGRKISADEWAYSISDYSILSFISVDEARSIIAQWIETAAG